MLLAFCGSECRPHALFMIEGKVSDYIGAPAVLPGRPPAKVLLADKSAMQIGSVTRCRNVVRMYKYPQEIQKKLSSATIKYFIESGTQTVTCLVN